MSIVSKIAIILTLSFTTILLTDIFYNYALLDLKGYSIILDLMHNNNIYLAFVGVASILLYLLVLKEEEYRKANRLEEINKVYPLIYTVAIPLIVIIIFTLFSPITKYFKDATSYMVFMFSMLIFSYSGLLMFLGIYSKLFNSQYNKSPFLIILLMFSGIAFLSNFIHLVIFEKIGLHNDCSFAICYEVNDMNMILFLSLSYLVFGILYWFHEDIFSGLFKVIMTLLIVILSVVINYYISKWLPTDFALLYFLSSYTYYIYQLLRMTCIKHSESIVKHASLW